MKKMIRFIRDDDGMELLQFALVVFIAVVVGALVIAIGTHVKQEVNTAKTEVEGFNMSI